MSNDKLKEQFEKAKQMAQQSIEKTFEMTKQKWEESSEFREKSIDWIKSNPFKSIASVWAMFALWLQGLHGSALVSLLFGLGGSIAGFSLAFGLALLPGLGFVLGLLVGVSLTDQQKQDLSDQLKHSPDWIKDNVIKLTEGMQSVWTKVVEAVNKDLQKWHSKKDDIEKAGEEISSLIQHKDHEEQNDETSPESDKDDKQ